ncbi:hypothetical protein COLO4_34892 [Corchorus olitorius]|uniref:Uncharacterized protein n=1 Tax=Corchorus olitorius TaxID=93759 RepID=A0A1R3GJ24_9ROSI|nr:hypothetical protein COLO4_34892 [Corchorus olitorius]
MAVTGLPIKKKQGEKSGNLVPHHHSPWSHGRVQAKTKKSNGNLIHTSKPM